MTSKVFCKTSKKRQLYGFTLIELLVVITIITLLISILLPALSAARKAARIIACGSNQRQDITALLMYAHDSDGWFPVTYWGNATSICPDGTANPKYSGAPSGSGRSMFAQYLGEDVSPGAGKPAGPLKVLMCPSSLDVLPDKYANYNGTIIGTTYRIVAARGNRTSSDWYGWATYTHRWPKSDYPSGNYGTPIPRLRLAGTQADQPSLQPAIADGWDSSGQWSPRGVTYFDGGSTTIHNNHEAGDNVGFVDGHVNFHKIANAKQEIRFSASSYLNW